LPQLTRTPAYQLAKLIRTREISVQKVIEAHLAQIGAQNPRLNALCTLDAEGARSRAVEADAATNPDQAQAVTPGDSGCADS